MKRVKAREGNKAAAGENTLDLVSFLAPAGGNGYSCKFVGAKESRPYGTYYVLHNVEKKQPGRWRIDQERKTLLLV